MGWCRLRTDTCSQMWQSWSALCLKPVRTMWQAVIQQFKTAKVHFGRISQPLSTSEPCWDSKKSHAKRFFLLVHWRLRYSVVALYRKTVSNIKWGEGFSLDDGDDLFTAWWGLQTSLIPTSLLNTSPSSSWCNGQEGEKKAHTPHGRGLRFWTVLTAFMCLFCKSNSLFFWHGHNFYTSLL